MKKKQPRRPPYDEAFIAIQAAMDVIRTCTPDYSWLMYRSITAVNRAWRLDAGKPEKAMLKTVDANLALIEKTLDIVERGA